jgi:serine/threonine protein kinase
VQAWLRTERPVGAWRQTLRAFKQAALGLYAVHRAGFVHGDFTPASVFLGADGQVHVRDLGQMRPSGLPGVLVGEPAYAAPEVIAGARVDERADQFSFCATMFEALYGTRPFPGDDPLHVVNAIRAGHVERPPAGFDGPPRLLDVLRRGLREDPGARWRDMMQLLQEIDRVVPQEAGPRQRRRVAWGLGIGLLLAKLAAVVASNTGACVSQG